MDCGYIPYRRLHRGRDARYVDRRKNYRIRHFQRYFACNFHGYHSTAGLTIVQNLIEGFQGEYSRFWELLGFVILTLLEFVAIVAVDLSERRIPVQYAKQVKGRKMYGGQSSNIPMRISGSGVMPLIFAFALISFPRNDYKPYGLGVGE